MAARVHMTRPQQGTAWVRRRGAWSLACCVLVILPSRNARRTKQSASPIGCASAPAETVVGLCRRYFGPLRDLRVRSPIEDRTIGGPHAPM